MQFSKSRVAAVAVGAAILAVFSSPVSAVAGDLINGSEIQNESVTGTDIDNGTVRSADIANESVTSADIDNGTVGSPDIKNDSIESIDIANSTITAGDMRQDTIQYIADQVADDHGKLTGSDTISNTSAGSDVFAGSFQAGGTVILNVSASFHSEEDTPVEVSIENSSGTLVARCATNLVAGGYDETCSVSELAASGTSTYWVYVSTPGALVQSTVHLSAVQVQ